VFWLRTDLEDEDLYSAGEVPAARILDEVGRLVQRLDLVHTLPAGYTLWRARTHNSPKLNTTPLLAATLFAHEAAAFGVHGSAGLDEHGGPRAASVSTISPG
jgi:hypothetical protein